MKKSVRQPLLVSSLVIIIIILTSCVPRPAAGGTPRDTAAIAQQVQSGSEGLFMQLVQNSPPPVIYDQTELIAVVDVRNRGNYPLQSHECFIQAVGFDPNIIRGGFNQPRDCTENLGGTELEGKNLYNTEGGFNQIEFRSSDVSLPEGVFEYNPTLDFKACYHYKTKANPQVCVDPLFYQVTRDQKTCQVRDIGMGGGQGGPVGVTHVGVDMIGNKAIFEITVQNLGTGSVISPTTDILACNPDYRDLDRVEYNVELSGSTPVNCKPADGIVRLSNKMGKIVCTFEIGSTSAYETPLKVELDYNYLQSLRQPLRIVKTPGTE